MFKFNPSSFSTSRTTFKSSVKDFVLDRYYSGMPQGTPIPKFVAVDDNCIIIGYAADSPRCIVVDNTASDPRDCVWTVYRGQPKAVTEAIKAGWSIGRIEKELCGDYEGTALIPDAAMEILKKHGPQTPKQIISDEDYCL